MDSTGQPYLRAITEDESGPWRSVLSHLPLYGAGLLVIWTFATLGRFSGDQSVYASQLHAATPTITFVTWLVLLVYTGFLILAAVRPGAREPYPSSTHRRLARAAAPALQTTLVMAIVKGGEVLISTLWSGPRTEFGDLWSTAVFYTFEAALGIAAFCTLFTVIALVASSLRGWFRYVLASWAGYVVVHLIQSYSTFVPLPWTHGTEFRSGFEFARSTATNVFINGFPGHFVPTAPDPSGGKPPFANIDLLNLWVNAGILVGCTMILAIVAVVSWSRTRDEIRRSGGRTAFETGEYADPTVDEADPDEASIIPWDLDDESTRSRRLGP